MVKVTDMSIEHPAFTLLWSIMPLLLSLLQMCFSDQNVNMWHGCDEM